MGFDKEGVEVIGQGVPVEKPKKDTKFKKGHKIRPRNPGRPKGARDFKPFLHDLLERRYKTVWGALDELESIFKKLSPKEQMDAHLRLLEIGVKISPKVVESTQSTTVNLILHGLGSKIQEIQGRVIPPPALTASEDDWEDDVDAPASFRAKKRET